MGRRPRPTKEDIARRERWATTHLPSIHKAEKPNAAYITESSVTTVLQHLSDAVNGVLMSRPLEPFSWIADYLRHSCKVAYCIDQDAASALVMDMHKKRRVIQNSLLDTKADDVESKSLIPQIQALESTLTLPEDELRLTAEDHEFLATETPRDQSIWSIDTKRIPLPSLQAGSLAQDWVERHLLPQRHVDEYVRVVRHGVVSALIEMELAAPDNLVEWIVLHFMSRQSSQQSSEQHSLLFKMNCELMRKIDAIKQDQRGMHLRRERLHAVCIQLLDEVMMRQRFIDKLRTTNTTARTHAIMNGTPCFLNGQKLWILPGSLLIPESLSPTELQGLHRAERFLMEEDETRWRFLLASQRRYDAATKIRATWKCSHDYRVYVAIKQRRHHAASIIQRNYFRYLYDRAISLPPWCVVGQEVMVSPSVAQRSAVTFQFYPKKDFPTGNFKRVEGLNSVAKMMEICRQDEGCAGFSTNGSFKRFVPRKLSQLEDMVARENQQLSLADGIYIKVFPSKTEKVVTTGIITAVPADRFGLITVVMDGIGVEETVPIQKLSERWKRIRIRRNKKEKKRKAFVFGGHQIVESEPSDVTVRSRVADYVVVEEDEEEAERRRRRERRVQIQSNELEATDPLVDFLYEDQSTKEMRRAGAHRTYVDDIEREREIAARKQEYAARKASEYEAKMLQSVVRLQCAWRSKRAREAFRQVLQLRAKEKERDRLVDAAHASNQRKIDQRRAKKHGGGGYFGKWLRR